MVTLREILMVAKTFTTDTRLDQSEQETGMPPPLLLLSEDDYKNVLIGLEACSSIHEVISGSLSLKPDENPYRYQAAILFELWRHRTDLKTDYFTALANVETHPDHSIRSEDTIPHLINGLGECAEEIARTTNDLTEYFDFLTFILPIICTGKETDNMFSDLSPQECAWVTDQLEAILKRGFRVISQQCLTGDNTGNASRNRRDGQMPPWLE